MSSDKLLVSYDNFAAKNGKIKRTLHLYRVIHNNEMLLVEDQATNTPKLFRSPNKNKYLFIDENTIFVLEATTHIVYMVSKETMVSLHKNANNQVVKECIKSKWEEQPSWCKEGKKISYLVKRQKYGELGGEVWVHDSLNYRNKMIYSSNLPIGLYGWTYDNQLLIWEGNICCLKIISLDGQLTSVIELDSVQQVFPSPTGERLIFSVEQRPKTFYMYCLKKHKVVPLLAAAEGGEFLPQINYSIDGNRIVTIERQGSFTKYIKTYDFEKEDSRVIKAPSHKSISHVPIWFNEHSFIFSSRFDEKKNVSYYV